MTDLLASLMSASKVHGSVRAVNQLDLDIRAGEVVALLGPNGAGKTTAISLLLGLQRPSEGTARLFGLPPNQVAARQSVGVMMQEAGLPPNLTVRELVELTVSYYREPMGVDEAIERAGVQPIASHRCAKLSGGQKRQAQFALAICGRPALLFLDEPTANLDVVARERLWRAVRELVAEGTSVVLTTHYIEEAEALADRVVVIDRGRTVAQGTVEQVRSKVLRKTVQCATVLLAEGVRRWPEVDAAEKVDRCMIIHTGRAEQLVRNLLAADPELSELEVRRAGLAEAIRQLTEGLAA